MTMSVQYCAGRLNTKPVRTYILKTSPQTHRHTHTPLTPHHTHKTHKKTKSGWPTLRQKYTNEKVGARGGFLKKARRLGNPGKTDCGGLGTPRQCRSYPDCCPLFSSRPCHCWHPTFCQTPRFSAEIFPPYKFSL